MSVLKVVLLRSILKTGLTILKNLGKRATLPATNTERMNTNSERISNTLDIDTSHFSMAELLAANKQLK